VSIIEFTKHFIPIDKQKKYKLKNETTRGRDLFYLKKIEKERIE
jgi:hypothetical protein